MEREGESDRGLRGKRKRVMGRERERVIGEREGGEGERRLERESLSQHSR